MFSCKKMPPKGAFSFSTSSNPQKSRLEEAQILFLRPMLLPGVQFALSHTSAQDFMLSACLYLSLTVAVTQKGVSQASIMLSSFYTCILGVLAFGVFV